MLKEDLADAISKSESHRALFYQSFLPFGFCGKVIAEPEELIGIQKGT
jgi:hypothetical protein